MNAAPIEFCQVTKRFGSTVALNDFSWKVPEGKITALLGPNGAGKTTAIKLAVGLHRADSGTVSLLGRNAGKLRSREFAQIGYVSENLQMPEWMTVAQLIEYCRPLYPTWDRELEKRMLSQFDLPLKRKLNQLSRGQAMKASLLSSMVYRPRVLILDEPFSGLDVLSRDEFIGGLLELVSGENWTILISSHDFFEIERLGDHLAILAGGKLRVDESAQRLQNRMRRLILTVPEGWQPPPASELPIFWSGLEISGRMLRVVDAAYESAGLEERLRVYFPDAVFRSAESLTLREIFVCLSRQYRLEGTFQAGGVALKPNALMS